MAGTQEHFHCLAIGPVAPRATEAVGKKSGTGKANRIRKRRKAQRSAYRKTVSSVVDPAVRKARRRWHSATVAAGQPPGHELRIEELARRFAEREALGIPLMDGEPLLGQEFWLE